MNAIETNYIALDQGANTISQSQDQIRQIVLALKTEMDKLYAEGFKDQQFTALQKVVNEFIQELNEIQKQAEAKIKALKERSQLIKQYYAVSL